jgi:hypothetical protein
LVKRLVREPLVHFLVLAIAVFGLYGLVASPADDVTGRIVISAPKIEQMEAIFSQTRMRPPTAEELKGLIDDYIAEELYVREALKLGLDQDDTVIRRRLRQKTEFLIAAEVEAQAPSEADLQAYLAAHPEKFETARRIGFEQVYLSPRERGDRTATDAQTMLDALQADPGADPELFGDATLLPATLPPSDASQIAAVFGPGFAAALEGVEAGNWFGPVASEYGLHLVRITSVEAGQLPPLDEVREAVVREWTYDGIQAATQERLNELLGRYEVIVDMPAAAPAP